MATIIDFQSAQSVRIRTESARLPGGEAEIVIFPGIRVEYWRELERPKAPEAPAATRPRKRRPKKPRD